MCLWALSCQQGDGAFGAGSCEHPTSWAEGGMGKQHPSDLSPVERPPSNRHLSGTFPAASFHTAASMLGLSRTDDAGLSSRSAGVSPSQSASTRFGVQLRPSLEPSTMQTFRARCAELPRAYPLPTLFLFLLPMIWDGGRA